MHTITWRLHLRASPEDVYAMLATPEGRCRFWAESADAENDGSIIFRFSNGVVLRSEIRAADPPRRFGISYFDDSTALFELQPDGGVGTDLTLTESGVSERNLEENRPGWVSLLLTLKAAVDHGVDLRNHDPERTWEMGYVDV